LVSNTERTRINFGTHEIELFFKKNNLRKSSRVETRMKLGNLYGAEELPDEEDFL
jgi:hypothetical protein